MSNMIAVGESGEFVDGTMKEILVNGREILIAKVGDKYYATEEIECITNINYSPEPVKDDFVSDIVFNGSNLQRKTTRLCRY